MWKKLWEIGVRGKMWTKMKNMTERARFAVMLDGVLSKDADFFARSCTGMYAIT